MSSLPSARALTPAICLWLLATEHPRGLAWLQGLLSGHQSDKSPGGKTRNTQGEGERRPGRLALATALQGGPGTTVSSLQPARGQQQELGRALGLRARTPGLCDSAKGQAFLRNPGSCSQVRTRQDRTKPPTASISHEFLPVEWRPSLVMSDCL